MPRGIISLKRSIDALDEYERREKIITVAYADLLKTCERTVELLVKEQREGDLSRILREAREAVIGGLSLDMLDERGLYVGEPYLDWVKTVDRDWRTKEQEYKRIVVMVTEAAEASCAAGSRRNMELQQFADQIDSVSSVDDVLEVRRRLTKYVEALRTTARSIEEDALEQADRLKLQIRKMQERLESAEEAAAVDSLTGLSNRRHAESVLADAISEGRRVCLILIDLDEFKRVNDSFGHSRGDQLLQLFATDLRRCVRVGDVVARWGGDEFVVVLCDTDLESAGKIVDRIRADAFGTSVLDHQGRQVRVTLQGSIGTAEHRSGESAADLFARADRLMYENKPS